MLSTHDALGHLPISDMSACGRIAAHVLNLYVVAFRAHNFVSSTLFRNFVLTVEIFHLCHVIQVNSLLTNVAK